MGNNIAHRLPHERTILFIFNFTSHDISSIVHLLLTTNINFINKFPETLQFPNLPKTIKKRKYVYTLQIKVTV